MATRICLFAFAVLFVVSQIVWATPAAPAAPAAPENKNITELFQETLSSWKEGLDDLSKKIGENPFIQNMTQTIQQWGKSAEQQGKQFFDQFNSDAKPKN